MSATNTNGTAASTSPSPLPRPRDPLLRLHPLQAPPLLRRRLLLLLRHLPSPRPLFPPLPLLHPPYIRSTPFSFSLFPFCFLVSLLSFALTLLSLALFPSPPPDPQTPPPTLTLPLSSLSLLRPLAAKSALITLVYLLRFHALRYCGAGASILADLAGALDAKSLSDDPRAFAGPPSARRDRQISGLAALLIAVSLLSFSWDRSGCFPLSSSPPPTEGGVRVAPMLLPFVSGFLAYHERAAGNWSSLRLLGRRGVQLLDSRPHCCYRLRSGSGNEEASFLLAEGDDGAVSAMSVGWPLINTVVFGVILVENYGDEKSAFGANFHGTSW